MIKMFHTLCSGCGICATLCPCKALRFHLQLRGYFRPTLDKALCNNCRLCLKVCPFVRSIDGGEVNQAAPSFISRMIGNYLKVGLSWSTDSRIRFKSASGGAITSIFKYLLERKLIDAVLVPKIQAKQGLIFGNYEVVSDSNEIEEYSGSIYAPVDITNALSKILTERLHVAIIGLPCQIRGLRKSLTLLPSLRERIKVMLGLYCNNLPSSKATQYAVKTLLKEDPRKIFHISFRGEGWPGYTTIITSKGRKFRIASQVFWGSGFGQYFYDKACFLCPDHTAELADISFADPWTYQKDIGEGKTLTVIRTKLGLEIVRDAVALGYLMFEEIPAIYSIHYTALLKKTVKVIAKRIIKSSGNLCKLPPSISTIIHEIDYQIGSKLANYEKLWPLLRLYMKVKPLLLKPLITLDYLFKPGFTRIVDKISKIWLER